MLKNEKVVKTLEMINPSEAGLISHTCLWGGVFSNTVNHSESVINHFTVK